MYLKNAIGNEIIIKKNMAVTRKIKKWATFCLCQTTQVSRKFKLHIVHKYYVDFELMLIKLGESIAEFYIIKHWKNGATSAVNQHVCIK